MDFGVSLFKLVVVAGTIAWLVLTRGRDETASDSLLHNRSLAALALLALYTYVNFGYFHVGPFVHGADFFHYYLSAKYFAELGYRGLYGAALAADAEQAEPRFGHLETVRDLRSAELIDADVLRNDPSFRRRFSQQRWQAFRRDLAYLEPLQDERNWARTLRDHGFNAPPSYVLLLRLAVLPSGAAGPVSVPLLAGLDSLLLVLTGFLVARLYGFPVAALCTVVVGADLSGFDWIGGSLLRYSWLVFSILGVCALQRERWALAGFLLGCAALIRIFPVMFAAGFLLQGVSGLVRERRWDRRYSAYLGGLALSALALIGPSLIFLGGTDAWAAFLEKILLHVRPYYGNHVGLSGVVGVGIPLWIGRLVLTGLYLACVLRVTPAQAAALGGVLVFAFGFIASYYYCLLVLFLLWQPRLGSEPLHRSLCLQVLAVNALALAMRLVSEAEIPVYDPHIYVALSAALVVVFSTLLVRILRRPGWVWSTV